jgi:hypothetical protein
MMGIRRRPRWRREGVWGKRKKKMQTYGREAEDDVDDGFCIKCKKSEETK